MSQTRKAKERDEFIHCLRQEGSPHRNSKGDGKGRVAEAQRHERKLPQGPDASSDTHVFTNTQLNLLMKTQIQQLLRFTLRRIMNAKCNYRKAQLDDKTQVHHLANRYVLKKDKFRPTHTWSHPDAIRKSAKAKTLQHSRNDLPNGPCAWKKRKGLFSLELVHNSRFVL